MTLTPQEKAKPTNFELKLLDLIAKETPQALIKNILGVSKQRVSQGIQALIKKQLIEKRPTYQLNFEKKRLPLEEIKKRKKANRAYNLYRKSTSLEKQPCLACNKKENTEGHHYDYDKPFHVLWLCRQCHAKLHALKRNPFNFNLSDKKLIEIIKKTLI